MTNSTPGTPRNPTPLLTTQQLATRLALSTKTVCKMARAGNIPAHRGRGTRAHWRFDLPAVLAALQRPTTGRS